MTRVVIVGGAGDMAGVIARRLLQLRPDTELVLADRDVERARRRVQRMGGAPVRAEPVDVFEPRGLRSVIRSAALVVNATGPYVRTAAPVLEACLDERVDYLDLGDDVEAADVQLAFDRAARDAGVTALIGAGIAPGVANVAVRRLAEELEEVTGARIAWVTGATPTRPGDEHDGRAVIDHMLHACTGMTVTVRGGRRQPIPAFRLGEVVGFPPPLGAVRVYDVGHAELATIPRAYPGIQEVRTQGGLVPAALSGAFRGIGAAVAGGRLTWDQAVDALVALDRGTTPRGRVARAVVAGIVDQVRHGELRRADLRDLVGLARGRPATPHAGVRVDVSGRRDGRPLALSVAAAVTQGPQEGGMDDMTGTPAAVFASLLLDGRVTGPGVRVPEQSVAPLELASTLATLGLPGMTDLLEQPPRVRNEGRPG